MPTARRGREDEVEVAALLGIALTEERRSELSVSKALLTGCPDYRVLVGAGEPVQPEDKRLEAWGLKPLAQH